MQAAEEQAALRRVATLAAGGAPQDEVFHAVAAETGPVLRADRAAVARYEPDHSAIVVGTWGAPGTPGPPPGSRWPVADNSNLGLILATQAPARVASYRHIPGQLSAWARENGVRWSVGTPITVERVIWGVALVFSGRAGQPPEGAEERLRDFTELAAMAIANTDSRARLVASRARIVAAADQARHRVERDLHDGAQQRLVTLALELRTAAARLPPQEDQIARQIIHAAQEVGEAIDELRRISQGLYPAALERGGLRPALRALARRCGESAEVSVVVGGRLPEQVEVAAYYVAAEALANVAKHAHASTVRLVADITRGGLRLSVTDNGTGGADPARGSGLLSLTDRVEALGGQVRLTSPPGAGTEIIATIPLPAA